MTNYNITIQEEKGKIPSSQPIEKDSFGEGV